MSVSSAQPGSCANATGRSTARAVSGTATAAGGGFIPVWGSVVQAAQTAAATAARYLGRGVAMIWFLLEALVALLLAVFIVWFTMGGKRKPSPPRADDDNQDEP
ncbi:MAG: hypothetical protein E6H60_08240 [Betaproteobacteria bacterium]|nr:MAG: hypothetical protein E6H60_08240 [Betaproteobacteria bacterium]